MITDWRSFKNALTEQFKPVNAVKTARDKLASIKQVKSVQEYSANFRSLVLEIPGITEDEKIDRFSRGLKDNVRLEVELREPATLNEAIKVADRYDTITFQHNKARPESAKRQTALPAPTGPIPMDIDNSRYRKLTEKDKEQLMKNRACFYCRKLGHMISSCPARNAKKPSYSHLAKSRQDNSNPSTSSKIRTLHRNSRCESEEEESSSAEEQNTGKLNIVEENQDGKLLKLNGFVKKTLVKILIDSGATRSFIAIRCVKKMKLKTCKEVITRSVISADGSEQPCTHIVHDVCIKIGEYVERLPLNIIKLQFYDIILGKSWLEKYNPIINWCTNEVSFLAKGKPVVLNAGSKKLRKEGRISLISATQMKKVAKSSELYMQFIHKIETDQQPAKNAKLQGLLKQFVDVFPKDLPAGLPPVREIDHHIDLTPGSVLPSRPTYRLS